MTKQDKIRIMARNFFTDNRDQYEDYHEAFSEFMSDDKVSDLFIDACVDPYIKPEQGHTLFMRDDGHVCSVKDDDGLFAPITEMTQAEGEEFEEQYESAMEEFPDIVGNTLLEKIGWRQL